MLARFQRQIDDGGKPALHRAARRTVGDGLAVAEEAGAFVSAVGEAQLGGGGGGETVAEHREEGRFHRPFLRSHPETGNHM